MDHTILWIIQSDLHSRCILY